MKLRNKKTGDIGELSVWYRADNKEIKEFGVIKENEKFPTDYKSLAELNEDWEDYEEPDGWCVTMYGGISRITGEDKALVPELKVIGNYFNDKESACDALDKLKAWKRLKDKGFSIDGYTNDIGDNYYMPSDFVIKLNYNGDHRKSYPDDVFKDLELLFGSEEDQ